MRRLTSALLEAGFLDITGMYFTVKNRNVCIPFRPEDKLSIAIDKYIICIVDNYGHTWLRPNILDPSEKAAVQRVKKALSTNKTLKVQKLNYGLILSDIWPHKYSG